MLASTAVLALLMSDASARDFDIPNPASNRYFYLPSAIPVEKGAGHFSQKELAWSSGVVGLTENVDLRLDSWYFLSFVGGLQVGTELGDTGVWFGAGAQVGVLEADFGGLAYVNYSIGSRDSNATVAFGQQCWFTEEDGCSANPFVVLAGQLRLWERGALVTENWVFLKQQELSIFSGGMRIFRTRRSLDLGVVVWDGAVFPWIDRTWYWD